LVEIFTTAGIARAAMSVKESGWVTPAVGGEGGFAPLTEFDKPNTGHNGAPHRKPKATMALASIRK
jgi:hypothetical protein